MKTFIGLIGLGLLLAAASPRSERKILWSDGKLKLHAAPLGKKGFAVMRLPATEKGERPKGARLLPQSDNRLQSIAFPVDRTKDMERWAMQAHEASGLCGSFDFFPLNYRLAETITHSEPYFPAEAAFDELGPLLEKVQLSQIDSHLDSFVNALPSRFHRHAQGMNAGQVLADMWRALATSGRWTISEVAHVNSPQKSVVARLEGESADTVILGAHLDSIAPGNSSSDAPGADDDASGIAVLSELLRVIDSEGLSFHRSIELHGYAAEEVGLIGSRELAATYAGENRPVKTMMQFDMTYYSLGTNSGVLHFLDDFSSLDLRRSAIAWTKQYIGPYYARGSLPPGTASDHKSWWEQGYPTLFAFENPDFHNSHVHTASDTRAQFDDGLLTTRIARLGLLFLGHQAGLTLLDESFLAQKESLAAPDLPKDLYIALQGSSEAATFSVSAPSTTAYLEFCLISEGTDLNCKNTRHELAAVLDQGDRRVFSLAQTWTFAAGERWRIYAYDENDEAVARRQFEWTASE